MHSQSNFQLDAAPAAWHAAAPKTAGFQIYTLGAVRSKGSLRPLLVRASFAFFRRAWRSIDLGSRETPGESRSEACVTRSRLEERRRGANVNKTFRLIMPTVTGSRRGRRFPLIRRGRNNFLPSSATEGGRRGR